MNLSRRFKLNTPSVSYKGLSDEIVIVNQNTGIYYSLDIVGSFIWNILLQGVSLEEILKQVKQKFEADPRVIDKDIWNFVSQLVDENLIKRLAEVELTFSFFEPPQTSIQTKSSYIAPCLNKYTEMQELLLLDPLFEEFDPNLLLTIS